MDARMIANLIDGLIMVAVGIWMTLQGYRVIGPKPGTDATFDKKYGRFGKWMKWGGPLLLAIGLLLMAVKGFGGQQS